MIRIPSPVATAVVPLAVPPSIKLISAPVVVIAVLAIDNASVSKVPSTSTSPDISNSVAIILLLNVAAPASVSYTHLTLPTKRIV